MLLICISCSNNHGDLNSYRSNPGNNQNYYRSSPYYQPAFPPPAVHPGYGGGYQYPPASRYYSNPYASPPQNQYPYYDADQYYVPPTYYGTSDSQVSDGGFEKF